MLLSVWDPKAAKFYQSHQLAINEITLSHLYNNTGTLIKSHDIQFRPMEIELMRWM